MRELHLTGWPFVVILLLAVVAGSSACAPARPSAEGGELSRLDFNRLAVRLNLPLFWVADRNGSGTPDPDEIVSLLFYPEPGSWVDKGQFTDAYREAYKKLLDLAAHPGPPADLSATERRRQELVAADLDHGIPTLVYNDLRSLPEDHQAFARHMLTTAQLIDEIYARQTGAEALESKLPDDLASQSLFRRNWGPEIGRAHV